MTYHTNHSFCSKCNHNDDFFDGGVMVYFGERLSTNFINKNFHPSKRIIDPDFNSLTEKKDFFDEEMFQMKIDYYESKGKVLTEEEINEKREEEKVFSRTKTVSLKEEVIDWLNKNIADKIDTTEDTPINDRKGWCTGNDEYNSKESHQITLFFARQKDALSFIKYWSIYNKPTFYFDYFHEDKREMDIKDIVKSIDNYNVDNGFDILNIGDIINIKHGLSTNLDESSYTFIDWEVDE